MRRDRTTEGSSAAVSSLFYRYAIDVHRFAARRLGDSAAADVTADVFRIAIERYESFDSGRGHPRAWLLGIAANLIRGHWRTEERRLRSFAREGGSGTPPIDPLLRVEDAMDADAKLARVMHGVAALSPEDRDLLTLFAWGGVRRSAIRRFRRSVSPARMKQPSSVKVMQAVGAHSPPWSRSTARFRAGHLPISRSWRWSDHGNGLRSPSRPCRRDSTNSRSAPEHMVRLSVTRRTG